MSTIEQVKIYQTAWRGMDHCLTDLGMKWRDYARCQEDCCPGTNLWNYFRGGTDVYKEAFSFVKDQVTPLPPEEQAPHLETYCAQLCTDSDSYQDDYNKKRAEENKNVVYYLSQEIAALRERFG